MMPTKTEIASRLTHSDILRLLHYDPTSGHFTWRELPPNSSSRKVGDIAGRVNAYGYRTVSVRKHILFAHRVAWIYMTGDWPVHEIDDIDGDNKNNAWSNLRQATRSQNCKNRKTPATNTTGVMGVCFRPRPGTWQAQYSDASGRKIYRNFHSLEEATAFRAAMVGKHYGEFTRKGGDE